MYIERIYYILLYDADNCRMRMAVASTVQGERYNYDIDTHRNENSVTVAST
jgi:hypothetical protein